MEKDEMASVIVLFLFGGSNGPSLSKNAHRNLPHGGDRDVSSNSGNISYDPIRRLRFKNSLSG